MTVKAVYYARMTQQNKKNQNKFPSEDKLIEQLRDVGRGVGKSLKSDFLGGIGGDALSSLFGSPIPKHGDLRPGQAVNINEPPQLPEYPERPYMPRFPRREQYKPAFSPETIQKLKQQEMLVQQKIDEIRMEIKAIMSAIKNVDRDIQQAVDENIVDPGVYHITFLDRLKTMLKLIRQNITESASWLSVMRSRRKQRGYWQMYKKKGTEFGLNHERVVATQVG